MISITSMRFSTLSLAVALLFALVSPAAATTPVGPIVNNGCPNENGAPQINCAKLGTGDRITVRATECGYNVPCVTDESESPEVCRSIINNSGVDYFVPWKQPKEWGAFLSCLPPMSPMVAGAEQNIPSSCPSMLPGVSVKPCCEPKQVPDICPDYLCEAGMPGYPNCSSLAARGIPDQLGYRIVGTRLPEPPPRKEGDPPPPPPAYLTNYGAQNDVYGPIRSADFFGDATINYEVTYTCNNGQWVKSYEKGSCTPTDGKCLAAYHERTLPAGFTLPTDLNKLCEPGSTFRDRSLADTGPGYTWICDGTPGRESSYCSTTKYTAPLAYNGLCNPAAHNGRLPNPPITSAEKCASGDPGILTGNGSDATPWVWSCTGGHGGSNQTCRAYQHGTPLPGLCGPANGILAPSLSWNPSAADMCARSFTPPVPVATGNRLDWTCSGESGGPDQPCAATLRTSVGACNYPGGYIVTTQPRLPPTAADLPPNACRSGRPANIAYNNATSVLSWQCVGDNGGGTADCAYSVDATLVKGICRWANGASVATIPAATSAALCTSGTAADIVTTGAVPTVGISWRCLGNRDGHDANCNIVATIRTDAVCGPASGRQLAAKPALAAQLCTIGTPGAVSGAVNGPIWGWTCAGLYGGLASYCGAAYSANPGTAPVPIDGICKPSQTVTRATTPSAPLCDAGIPTAVTGRGPWTWQCQGIDGGRTATCVAPLLGAGYCGATHGTRIPNDPNFNLCATGTPGPVTGNATDGWNWTCTGTNTVSCHADPCDLCAGDLPRVTVRDLVGPQTINYGSGTCRVRGSVEWQEVDLITSANNTYVTRISDAGTGLAYSKSQQPGAAPVRYCTPCYRQAKTLAAGRFVVRRVADDVCNTGTALDSEGNEVEIPASAHAVEVIKWREEDEE